jgi:glycosyltransferase involved in cell wall biosynthesis
MSGTYASATQIVATTRETLRKIPTAYQVKGRVQQAVGIDAASLQIPGPRGSVDSPSPQGNGKLNLLFVGRLLPWKGMHLGLKALAALNSQGKDVHLTIIGSGSDQLRLKNMAKHLKIAEAVCWIPWMPRQELIRLYASFDLFLFPSLHDSGGMAVLEAMSLGLPVLCLDLGGPGQSVDNTSGCVIATTSRSEAQVIQAIADFLKQVLHEPALLTQLSQGARRRVQSLTWDATVRSLYSENLVPQTK